MTGSRPETSPEALQTLLDGNDRFRAGMSQHPNLSALHRNNLIEGQQPFATIVTCSDSRVAPELLFDQGLGDLFVIRVAGNVVDDSVAASVAYAVDVLNTPLVMVLGHENCGAVSAALQAISGEVQLPDVLQPLLRQIEPALRSPEVQQAIGNELAAGVAANVRASMTKLNQLCDACSGSGSSSAEVVGAVYSLRSGDVEVLDA